MNETGALSAKRAANKAARSKSASPDKRRLAAHENASVEKILNGALSALSRRGSKKLTMGDIGDAAGVSRGTLYRYFSSKEEVLLAMSEAVSRSFETGMAEITAAEPGVVGRAREVLAFQWVLALQEQNNRILDVEPEFVLAFLRSHFERHVAAMADALIPVVDRLEDALGSKIDRRLLAEAFVRMELSTLIVPGNDKWNEFPRMFARFVQQADAKAPARRTRARVEEGVE